MSLMKFIKLNFLVVIILLGIISASNTNRIKKDYQLRNKEGQLINMGSVNLAEPANNLDGANFKPKGKVIRAYTDRGGNKNIVYQLIKKNIGDTVNTTTTVLESVVHDIKLGKRKFKKMKKMKKSKRNRNEKIIEELEDLIKDSNNE